MSWRSCGCLRLTKTVRCSRPVEPFRIARVYHYAQSTAPLSWRLFGDVMRRGPEYGTRCQGQVTVFVQAPPRKVYAAFLQAKLATGRYYMARQLPACGLHLARIESGAEPVMALAAEAF